jgi:hypothetical protein
MSIGNFFSALGTGIRGIVNGVDDVAESLPVVGGLVKQVKDAGGKILGAGDKVASTQNETPDTYNTQADNVKEGEQGSSIGNLMSPSRGAAEEAKKEGEAESGANAAKAAAADDAAAEEVAEMLI